MLKLKAKPVPIIFSNIFFYTDLGRSTSPALGQLLRDTFLLLTLRSTPPLCRWGSRPSSKEQQQGGGSIHDALRGVSPHKTDESSKACGHLAGWLVFSPGSSWKHEEGGQHFPAWFLSHLTLHPPTTSEAHMLWTAAWEGQRNQQACFLFPGHKKATLGAPPPSGVLYAHSCFLLLLDRPGFANVSVDGVGVCVCVL